MFEPTEEKIVDFGDALNNNCGILRSSRIRSPCRSIQAGFRVHFSAYLGVFMQRSIVFGLVLVVLAAAVLFRSVVVVGSDLSPAGTQAERPPDGGGEAPFQPTDEISEGARVAIWQEIRSNIDRLEKDGRLSPATPQAVPLTMPVEKSPGLTDFDVIGISNYVDHNFAFPNQLQDYNCGTRTYDLSSGYNHRGIDFFTWPFSWNKMDNNAVRIVAAAPGTIVSKSDGNFDRSCSIGSGSWNAVYVRHADNSIAWYGHMKSGSLTTKSVGESVVAGEYLGIVGSSGSSTGPHLHFELYDSGNNLQDPYQGNCNTLNAVGWWAVQEPYRNSKVNKLMTGSAGPVFPSCPNPEISNEKKIFRRGDALTTSAYFRDQLSGHQTQYALVRPDGNNQVTWSHTSPNSYNASYWFWNWTVAANAPAGQWKLRATYQSVVYETTFVVAGTGNFDMDGDGKTDISVFRPVGGSGSEWWYLRSSDGGNRAFAFGEATDTVVPADFTGDGKADLAFWRPASGEWFVLRSEDSTFFAFPFGAAGDVPSPADFDGDGKSDATVYRPSTNTWFTLRSSDGQVSAMPFGTAGDKPVPADYDGDGKADVAIFRPTGGSGGGEWWYLRSSDGANRAFAFGTATDLTVPGDYTGDGKADLAYFRPSTGEWYVLRSEDSSFYAFPWGASGDVPAPGDYDGDGKIDAAVFRPSNSNWFALRSTAGPLILQFGTTGDRPLPNAFVR